MKIGITVGKFYPFHLGHDLLIRSAKRQVERLIVLVCWKPQHLLSGALRAGWIRELHPDVEVIEVLDDLPEAPQPWATRALEVLGGRKPDLAFSSEDYGEAWARNMGARHVAVDCDRRQFPISGTMLRADLGKHWDMLSPGAKAHFAKRVSIVGVESSGTTTLAVALAAHFKTVCVPEYGRYYWEGRQQTANPHDWDSYEFERIAARQGQWEDDLARRANKLVICDTDPLATHVWHRRYIGSYSDRVQEIAAARRYELSLVTEPDFDFVQDGTRDGEQIRDEMHAWFLETMIDAGRHFEVVTGTREQRLTAAKHRIETLLSFAPLDAP